VRRRWLLNVAKAVIMAEELREAVREEVRRPPPKPAVEKLVIDRPNVKVEPAKPRFLVKEDGSGVLEEVLIRSPSKSFRCRVTADRRIVWDKTYDGFEIDSDRLADIYAKDEDGVYVVHLSNVPFKRSIRVLIKTSDVITFNRLYASVKLNR